jgi:ATP-dependent DNA helicase RecQ
LSELRAIPALENVPTLVLTATATPRVMDEISRVMALRDPVNVRGDFARPNLRFSVRHLRSDAARMDTLSSALEAEGLRSRVGAGRAIVYCSTRKKAETVAAALKATGFAAAHYHAGRTTLARDRAQRSFALGKTRVLVATSAFGMGIDYPDVRLLVHFQTPGSLEAYYQEAGRAGRDGEPAKCVMLFGAGDMATQRRLSSGESARAEQALLAIERYAGSNVCRQVYLCSHFTGTSDHVRCETCDVCTGLVVEAVDSGAEEAALSVEVASLSSDVRDLVLAAAAAMQKPCGKTNLAKALRGSKAKTVAVSGLMHLPQAGTLAHVSEAALIALIDTLVTERKLVKRGRKYPMIWLHGRAEPESRGASSRAPRAEATARAAPKRSKWSSSELSKALERFRKTTARQLKWKPYMVFQQRVITALEAQKPSTLSELERIPGLGHAKIERFGTELLALVRRHA